MCNMSYLHHKLTWLWLRSPNSSLSIVWNLMCDRRVWKVRVWKVVAQKHLMFEVELIVPLQ